MSEVKKYPSWAKRNYLILAIMLLCRFLGDSFFYGFLYRYITTLKFEEIQFGILTALIPFMAVLGNLFISKVGTNFKRRRILILIYSLVEPTAILFFGFRTEFYYVLILDIVCNFLSNAFYNLTDTYIMEITKDVGKNYSAGRVMGTFGYIIGVIIGGNLIANLNYKWTFVIGAGLMYLTFLFFNFIRFPSERQDEIEKSEIKPEEDKKSDAKELWNRNYVFLFIGAALLYGSIWAGDNFFQQLTSSYTPEEYAYSYDAAIVMEAVGHLFCSRFHKLKNYKAFIKIAALSLLVRYIIFAIPGLNKYVYLSFEVLRGISFSFCGASILFLLGQILPFRLTSRGYFILIAADQLFAATVNLIGPYIMKATGNNYILPFAVLASCALISFVMLSLVRFNDDPKIKEMKDVKA